MVALTSKSGIVTIIISMAGNSNQRIGSFIALMRGKIVY